MKQIFNFFGKYLNEKKGILTLYILICIFGSMTTVVFPYISGSFIDRLVQATDTSFLGRYILIFALFSIVGLILQCEIHSASWSREWLFKASYPCV